MKTLALGWESVISKIHPPLPISRQDSQRLLAQLNTSFKQQLQKRHPDDLPSSESRTDAHLSSILTNPLFRNKANNGPSRSLNQSRSTHKSFSHLQDLMTRPMDVFRDQVSAGNATLETARLCLDFQLKNNLASNKSQFHQSTGDSTTSSTVLNWLWSSGIEESFIFLEHRQFITSLAPFLAAEQKHNHILKWLYQLDAQLPNAGSETSVNEIRRKQAFLNLQMVKSESLYGQGLNSAVQLYNRSVIQRLKAKIVIGIEGALTWTGLYLTKAASQALNHGSADEKTINLLLESNRIWSQKNSLILAWQQVFQPENSSADSALQYLRIHQDRMSAIVRPRRPYLMFMGLEAAQLLLRQDRQTDAIWVMQFLETNFPREFGLSAPAQGTSKVKEDDNVEEQSNMLLLDSLAVH